METFTASRDVSIRAPVRGATWWRECVLMQPFVSIRAPVRGATLHGVA